MPEEFDPPLWLDDAAESPRLLDEIKAAGVRVILHPTMARATGERENLSFETAAKLVKAGIPVALESGPQSCSESYVPKTRLVLFEAALASAHGLTFEQALATITITPARILGVSGRLGYLEIGKHADLAVPRRRPLRAHDALPRRGERGKGREPDATVIVGGACACLAESPRASPPSRLGRRSA